MFAYLVVKQQLDHLEVLIVDGHEQCWAAQRVCAIDIQLARRSQRQNPVKGNDFRGIRHFPQKPSISLLYVLRTIKATANDQKRTSTKQKLFPTCY